jgi:hypothetical protein
MARASAQKPRQPNAIDCVTSEPGRQLPFWQLRVRGFPGPAFAFPIRLPYPFVMRLVFLSFALAAFGGIQAAAAQQADSRAASGNGQERIALSARPERAAPARPRLACAPLMGTVYDPNGKPLVGATLLIKGTHDIYVTDSEGRFQLTDPVYEGQILDVQAAGYSVIEVPLDDCTLPRLVLAPMPTAKFKQHGKKEGQVIRLNHRSTNLH